MPGSSSSSATLLLDLVPTLGVAPVPSIVVACSGSVAAKNTSRIGFAAAPGGGWFSAGSVALARAVERELEEHGSDHLIERHARDCQRSETLAKLREGARDDHAQAEREPCLRNQRRPTPAANERRIICQTARPARADDHRECARAAQHERDRPELAQERNVEVGAGRREEDREHQAA